MPLQSDSLLDLISCYKTEYNLNEYELYRLIETGFHGFFKFRPSRDVPSELMTYLRRALQREQSWFLMGVKIPIAEWVEEYSAWRP